jgi:hypothetical protein
MDREPAGAVGEVVALDSFDGLAVIVLGQNAGDCILQVESSPENE